MRRWVIALSLAGCYSPSFQTNVPCSADLSCPNDQTCDTSQSPPVCVGQLGSNGPDGGDNLPPDAPTMSACGVCPAAMPVCDQNSTTCRVCYDDDDCTSHVCDELTGTCTPTANTLFVKTEGDDANPCTHDQPCLTVSKAITLVDDNHKIIRIYDGTYFDTFVSQGKTFTLSGEFNGQATSALLMYTGSANYIAEVDGGTVVLEGIRLGGGGQAGLKVQGGATVTLLSVEIGYTTKSVIESSGSTLNIYGGELHDSGGAGPGVFVQSGSLTMLKSLTYNIGGPNISVTNAKYDLENNFITGSGGPGLVQMGPIVGNTAKFDFNTVVGNTTGVAANANIAVSNSIFAYNGTDVPLPMNVAATYSLVTGPSNVPGTGNINADPAFVAQDDLHITFGSPARDKADPASLVRDDYDGDARPHGAGFDIGADEHY
ncbi:MAG: choice-of-anchor Q domain-containing protein [Kofleriaceae bacterium]